MPAAPADAERRPPREIQTTSAQLSGPASSIASAVQRLGAVPCTTMHRRLAAIAHPATREGPARRPVDFIDYEPRAVTSTRSLASEPPSRGTPRRRPCLASPRWRTNKGCCLPGKPRRPLPQALDFLPRAGTAPHTPNYPNSSFRHLQMARRRPERRPDRPAERPLRPLRTWRGRPQASPQHRECSMTARTSSAAPMRTWREL